jgi:hypothetical protein
MSIISGGGGLSSSSLFSTPSWQSSTPSFGGTTADLSTGLPSGMPDWSDTTSASTSDAINFFSDAISNFASTWSTATTSELSGAVNNAADAAAKRLGVNLPSSSSSSTTKSPSSSSKSSSATGQNLAFKNIDGVLAALDGHPQSTGTTSTAKPFNFQSFLNNLDNIASGVSTSNAPATPTGKNFSIDSYLATLDKIIPHAPPTVNVTT